MNEREIEKLFKEHGSYFHTPLRLIKEQMQHVKCLVLDWRGVFNDGFSQHASGSYEQDAYGLQMFRFSYWLAQGELPFIAIIAEEHQKDAWTFSQGANLSAYYYSVENKKVALDHIADSLDISYYNMALVFDDAPDLPSAKQCGLRFLVNRHGSPLMYRYLKDRHWVDYITAQTGGGFAVREICELLTTTFGNAEEVLEQITDHAEVYQNFKQELSGIEPAKFFVDKKQIRSESQS